MVSQGQRSGIGIVAELVGFASETTKLDSYMIACSNPGDQDFVAGFKKTVPSYAVVNWSADLVPKVPSLPFVPLLDGVPAASLQNVATIEPSDFVVGG